MAVFWRYSAVPRPATAAVAPPWKPAASANAAAGSLFGLPSCSRRRLVLAESSPATPAACPAYRNRVFVKGLSRSTTEGSLLKSFSRFGVVTRVKVITSKSSKESQGLAYVWFQLEEEAHEAVEKMNVL
ncbi:uncharacterized protein LOC144711601 isoform X2 [Wolffia australiana]